MESKETMFQLDQAILGWKASHQASHAVSSEAMTELESHLRDSVASLEDSGLSEEEAFLIASRRLGSPAEIAGEYGKIHPNQVWLSRTLLMLCGYLIISLLLKFIAFDQATASIIVLALGLESTPVSIPLLDDGFRFHWSGVIHALVGIAGLGVFAALVLSFARGTWQPHANVISGHLGKLLALWVAIYGLMTVVQLALHHFQFRIQESSQHELANYSVSAGLAHYSTQMLTVSTLVLVTAILGRRYVQSRA